MTDLETLAFARQIIAAHNGHMRRLAAETHARESAEAELRETVGELERTGDDLDSMTETARSYWTRMTDAIALLERCRTGEATDSEIADFLSGAPAQPARSQPTIAELTEQWDDPQSYSYGAAQDDSAPAQPAASTPVTAEQIEEAIARGVRDARIVAGDPVMPAAPEPSAEPVAKERYLLQCEVAESLRIKLLAAEAQLAAAQRMAEERKEAWLAACAKLESTRDVLRLARASGCVPALVCAQFEACLQPDTTPLADAEAQLAAVKARVAASLTVLESGLQSRNYRAFAVRVLESLTAPSPGAALDGACYCREYQSRTWCPPGRCPNKPHKTSPGAGETT